MKRAALERTIDDALAHVEKLLDAARGDDSRCSVFRSRPGQVSGDPAGTANRDAIERYVSSWIEGPLRAALILAREDDKGPGTYSLLRYVNMLDNSSRFGAELRRDRAGTLEEAF